jgi:hypothetical protein
MTGGLYAAPPSRNTSPTPHTNAHPDNGGGSPTIEPPRIPSSRGTTSAPTSPPSPPLAPPQRSGGWKSPSPQTIPWSLPAQRTLPSGSGPALPRSGSGVSSTKSQTSTRSRLGGDTPQRSRSTPDGEMSGGAGGLAGPASPTRIERWCADPTVLFGEQVCTPLCVIAILFKGVENYAERDAVRVCV